MVETPPSLTAVVELTAAEPKLELAMALTAMVLTVVREVMVVTFLLSNVHCRALPGTPATVAVRIVKIPPLPDGSRRAVRHRAAASWRWRWC